MTEATFAVLMVLVLGWAVVSHLLDRLNITGALVFQSTLPMAVGLAFTSWELDSYSLVAGCLALAGGLVAILTLQVRRRFNGRAIALWAALYVAFVVYVVSTA